MSKRGLSTHSPNIFPSELTERFPDEKPPPPSDADESRATLRRGVLMALRDTHKRFNENLSGTGKDRSGATCEEIQNITGLRYNTCSARLRELEFSGHVYMTSNKRRTSSGGQAFVYEPTDKGWAV